MNVVDSLIGNICLDDEIYVKLLIYFFNKDYFFLRIGVSNCECMVVKNLIYIMFILIVIEMYIFDFWCLMLLVIEIGDGKEILFLCNYKFEGYRKWKDLSLENIIFILFNL